MTLTVEQARRKLAAARTRLVLERPFIGTLLMHLPLEPAIGWCETVATDARTIYFNAAYVQTLDFGEAQFVLAHEALHCALGHFARRAHRSRYRWDLACDHAVNLLLVDEGFSAPAGALFNPDFRGRSAEEIYPVIPDDSGERTLDRHIADDADLWSPESGFASAPTHPGDKPQGCTPIEKNGSSEAEGHDDGEQACEAKPRMRLRGYQERDALRTAWRGRAIVAAQRARGRMPGSWARLFEGGLQPATPWRALLARYLMSAARLDYTYQRPSRREGNAILPRVAAGEADLCVAVDTSGSIGSEELAQFTAEIDSLKAQIPARLTLLACDERMDERAPWRFAAWEPVAIPGEWRGGGGTSFVPVFDWAARQCYRPDVLVYFTDAHGDFPEVAPEFPVMWIVKGDARVPWGQRIQLD